MNFIKSFFGSSNSSNYQVPDFLSESVLENVENEDGFVDLGANSCVRLAVDILEKQDYFNLPNKSQFLTKDLKTFNNSVSLISREEKSKCKSAFARIYGDLTEANKKLDNNSLRPLFKESLAVLKKALPCLSDNYVALSNFSELGREVRKSNPKIQGLSLGINPAKALVFANTPDSNQQGKVLAKLDVTFRALNDARAVKNLTNTDLMQIKLAACALRVGCVDYEGKEDHNDALANSLMKINAKINDIIRARIEQKDCDFSISSPIIDAFEDVNAAMKNSGKFSADFWEKDETISTLKSLFPSINGIVKSLESPKLSSIDGLSVVAFKSSNIGLFKTDAGEYVVVLKGEENLMSHFNYNQGGRGHQFGGMVHLPVVALYEELNGQFANCLAAIKEDSKGQNCTIIVSGFGLLGAAANILAHKASVSNSNDEFVVCSVGTPPSFDIAAANKMRNENLRAVNFVSDRDALTRASRFSNWVAKSYAETNWNLGVFSFRESNMFVSDVTGHDPKIYLDQTSTALQKVIEIHDLFKDINMVIGNRTSNDKSEESGEESIDNSVILGSDVSSSDEG